MTTNDQEVIAWLTESAERGARFLRSQTPDDLRAWAARAEDFARNGLQCECLPALDLENAAQEGRKALERLCSK